MGRPKLYLTEAARKAANKKKEARRAPRISGKYFRLVIPSLTEYETEWSYDSRRIKALKERVLDLLFKNEKSRGLEKYVIAVERHPGSGLAHLDILLVYSKKVRNSYTRYDYLIKHGNLTKYRTLNKAILEYGTKEDPSPLSNVDAVDLLLADRASTKEGLYELLEQAMLKDPFKFESHRYLNRHNLHRNIVKLPWTNVLSALKKKQHVVCNNILRDKPGIRLITPELIRERLSDAEFQEYHSWSGYQTIVDHINQIPRYGCRRPHKTKNLFICGPPDTGKTSLALAIERHCSVYYKGVSKWFPSYEPDVYQMILWNEFSLKGMKYSKVLNLLEGAKMDMEYKGGSVLKTDNQLVYMNSNLTLEDHIRGKFRSVYNRLQAHRNLRARVTEVCLTEGRSLFILLKLIVRVK